MRKFITVDKMMKALYNKDLLGGMQWEKEVAGNSSPEAGPSPTS